jgi:hypothetical protein
VGLEFRNQVLKHDIVQVITAQRRIGGVTWGPQEDPPPDDINTIINLG